MTGALAGAAPALETKGVTKSFGAVRALSGVDMYLNRGEILGLVGDNGAGKSTLVKILCGFHQPDSGQIFLSGREVKLRSVVDARRNHGVDIVYQDLALIPELPVYYNLFLGRELVAGGPVGLLRRRRMRELAAKYLAELKLNLPTVDARVGDLSGGQRQAIAVARAIWGDAKVLLLDEPLAAMGAKEAAQIIDLVRRLVGERDVSVIVVDHNYRHIFDLCDRITIIQDHVAALDIRTADTSIVELTEMMIAGGPLSDRHRREVAK